MKVTASVRELARVKPNCLISQVHKRDVMVHSHAPPREGEASDA